MDHISVAVIIPTHKRPELLKRAISSIIKQTYAFQEVIVVDDASDENTKNVVNEFQDGRIKYYRNQRGQGAPSSRNYGAEIALSEYVAFLDDDDEWYPEKLELQVNLMKDNQLDVCFSQIAVAYENTNIGYATRAKNVENPIKEILIENYLGATISALIKRDLFFKVGKFDLDFPARQDFDLWIRLITSGARVGVVEKPLAISYRSLEGRSRISSSLANYEKAIARINTKYNDLIHNHLSPKELKLRRIKQLDFLASHAVSINAKMHAVKYYLKSLMLKPRPKTIVALIIAFISPKLLIRIRSSF